MPEQRVSDEDASVEHITAKDLEQASKIAADAVRAGALRVSIAAGPGREARVTIVRGAAVSGATNRPAALAE